MIEFEATSKIYTSAFKRRQVAALTDFAVTISRGEVFGIAGPNGAGKSTMISLLLGFLAPTGGTVRIDGVSPRRFVESRGVGYLTEQVNLPGSLKVTAFLRRMAILSGVAGSERGRRVAETIERLGLTEYAGRRIKQLSKGNLQRLALGQALLGQFDLVVLDEPTHGLDPVWTQRFRTIVAELRRPERAVVIASHNLDELEQLSDRVAILDHGRLQRVVDHSAEVSEAALAWRLVLEPGVDVAAAFAQATPVADRPGNWRVIATRPELSRSLAALLTAGGVLVECVPERGRLESAFREVVGE